MTDPPLNATDSALVIPCCSAAVAVLEFESVALFMPKIPARALKSAPSTNAIAVFNKDVSNPLYPSIGDEVSVEGTLSNYYSLFQIKNPTTEVINSSDNVVGLLPTVSTIEDILSLDSTNRLIHGKQYTISGTISIDGDFSNVYINNGNRKIFIAYYSPTT